MTMDQVRLAKSARDLEEILLRYVAVDTEISSLFDALSGLIDDAKTGKILHPLAWRDIPAAYRFAEGAFRKYVDLETTYAEFKIESLGA
jgi:hypothetical protein